MVVSVWTLTLYLAQVNAGVHVYALESDGSVSQGHVYALEPSRSRKLTPHPLSVRGQCCTPPTPVPTSANTITSLEP